MSHLVLNILFTIHDIFAIWDVCYWEVSLYHQNKGEGVCFYSVLLCILIRFICGFFFTFFLYWHLSVFTHVWMLTVINSTPNADIWKKHENCFFLMKLKIFYIWALNFPVYWIMSSKVWNQSFANIWFKVKFWCKSNTFFLLHR